MIDVGQRNSIRDRNAAFLFPPDDDGWWLFIQAYSKTFEFGFDDLLVSKRLEDIEDNENEVTCASD